MIDRSTAGDVDSIRRLTTADPGRATEVPEVLEQLVRKRSVAHLSSVGPDGAPHAHPVWFDVAGGRLLISTGTDRQKYRNVRRDPRVSVSVLDPDDPYRYVECRGRVVEVEPDPQKAFLDRLAQRYLGLGTYPYAERRGVERVILHIQPDHVVCG